MSFIFRQASGVAVSDDCVTVFNDLKLKHDKKYIIFSMNAAMTEIQVLVLFDAKLALFETRPFLTVTDAAVLGFEIVVQRCVVRRVCC
jgi:hypothetical protein